MFVVYAWVCVSIGVMHIVRTQLRGRGGGSRPMRTPIVSIYHLYCSFAEGGVDKSIFFAYVLCA